MESAIVLIKNPEFVLECLKLVISLVAGGLVAHDVVVGTDLSQVATVYVTLMGFPMLQVVVLMSEVLKTPVHRTILLLTSFVESMFYSVSATIMVVASVSVTHCTPVDRLSEAAILSYADTAVCLVSFIMVARRREADAFDETP